MSFFRSGGRSLLILKYGGNSILAYFFRPAECYGGHSTPGRFFRGEILCGGNSMLQHRDMPCLSVKIPKIQQQTNGVDCGLFAIANVVQTCFGSAPDKRLITHTHYLREHLIYCLERQYFVPFPKHDTKEKINRKKPYFLDISCDCRKCRLPNVLEEMVGCDARQCSVWLHRSCTNKASDDGDDWFCSPHRM